VKILSMTASFGCLNQSTLTLQDGVNLFCLPNESGKSTWAAFLLAMLYGIDSSERASKGKIPAKTKYLPWNGAPMSGTLIVEQEGREIVLERTSVGSRPMAQFRAYDRHSGQTLPELTAENCGKQLLGVEREVFRRTAFLSGQELQVTQDADLAKRLAALAASGSTEDSYPAAAERLKAEKNRLRYHQNGLIPNLQIQLRRVQGQLDTLASLRRQRIPELSCVSEDLTQQLQQEQTQWEARRDRAYAAYLQAQAEEAQLAATAARLPSEERLGAFAIQLAQPLEALPPEPPCPLALTNLTPDEIIPRAQADTAACGSGKRRLLLIPALLTAALGIHSFVTQHWISGLLLTAAAVFWLLPIFRESRTAELCAGYGVSRKEDILPCALARRDWLLTQQRLQEAHWQRSLLLDEIAAFAPHAEDTAAAQNAVTDALAVHRRLAALQVQLQQAEQQWFALRGATFTPSSDLLQKQMAQAAQQARTEALLQQEQALGSAEALDAEKQKLEQTLADLLQKEAALELAQEALKQAQDLMTQTYAPQLTALAGQVLSALTDGRYSGVILQEDLSLLLQEAQTGLIRPLAALSRGTQDQAWLALRLAMTQLLLPDGPLVLDDALLTFDEARTAAALETLCQEGRQILLFSCRPLTAPD